MKEKCIHAVYAPEFGQKELKGIFRCMKIKEKGCNERMYASKQGIFCMRSPAFESIIRERIKG